MSLLVIIRTPYTDAANREVVLGSLAAAPALRAEMVAQPALAGRLVATPALSAKFTSEFKA